MNEDEYQRVTGFSLEEAVGIRLWDIANQCEKLMARGDLQALEILRKEGLHLSQSYDQKEMFILLTA